ncbi:hypothetical protein HNR33_002721 [Brassicibacter mesophilus]
MLPAEYLSVEIDKLIIFLIGAYSPKNVIAFLMTMKDPI